MPCKNSEFEAGFRETAENGSGHCEVFLNPALAAFEEIGDHLAVTEGRTFTITGKLRQDVDALERELIERALDASHGRINYAARTLGLSHQTLNYMLNTRQKDLLEKRKTARRDLRKR